MKVFCPLYVDLDMIDEGKVNFPRVYLAGAANLAQILPPQTLIVHFYPYQPQSFAHFSIMRLSGWVEAVTTYPDDWFWSTDADIIPSPNFASLLLDL